MSGVIGSWVIGMAQLNAKSSLVVGVLAGIGASICCVGPLVLLALGISGEIGRAHV